MELRLHPFGSEPRLDLKLFPRTACGWMNQYWTLIQPVPGGELKSMMLEGMEGMDGIEGIGGSCGQVMSLYTD